MKSVLKVWKVKYVKKKNLPNLFKCEVSNIFINKWGLLDIINSTDIVDLILILIPIEYRPSRHYAVD